MKHVLFLMAAIGGLFNLVNPVSGAPFVLSSSPGAGVVAYSVGIGDLNGDGRPDLVSVDGSQLVSTFTNAGNGIFLPSATYNLGSGSVPYSVAIADFNGDGKPDLAIACATSVIILTNAGGGNFVFNASCPVSNESGFVAAADINGDGKPDIISGNFDGTLTVFTNAGGTFLTAYSFQANFPGFGNFAVADINGDGKPDLIVPDSSFSQGDFVVFTNSGGGIFGSNALYIAGSANGQGPNLIAAGDFNNDGKMDVVSADQDSTVTVFTNAGNGVLAKSQTFSENQSFLGLLATDVDGDSQTDLLSIAVHTVPSSLTVLTTEFNNGGGVFSTNSLTATNFINSVLPDSSINWMAAADLNGDGKPDVVVADNHGLYVFTNSLGSFPNRISVNVYSNVNSAPVTNIIARATSPSGAAVNFTTTSTNWTGALPVTNNPPSGSVFPVGVTTVTASTAYFVKGNLSASTNATFTVTVTDLPVITLLGANPLTDYVAHYSDPGATATDAVYGNLTGSIVVTGNVNANVPGTYTVTYSVTNALGYGTAVNRTVVIAQAPQGPIITMLGANPLTNFVDHYSDPGATASDPVYGNLTGSIVVSGNLNTNVPGNYTVTYSATDPSANTASTNRAVVIIALPALGVASAAGGQAALFWPPGSDTNYVLQMTTNLNNGNWVNVTNGTRGICVFVTNNVPAAYFRLQPQ
jgi:hypothetical protein